MEPPTNPVPARLLNGLTALLAWGVVGLDLDYLLRPMASAFIAPRFDSATGMDLACAAIVAITASRAAIARSPASRSLAIVRASVFAVVFGAATTAAIADPVLSGRFLPLPSSWVALLGVGVTGAIAWFAASRHTERTAATE